MSEVMAKAARCKRLLEDQDLQQAFRDVRSALHDSIEGLKLSQTEELKDFKKMLHLLRSVEANLHRAIEDGNLEEFRVAENEKTGFLGELKWARKR